MLRPYEGREPRIHATAHVDEAAVVIGDVELAADASLWPMVVARGDVNYIRIGERSNVQDGTVIHVAHAGPYNTAGHPTLIGADVTIGHNATVHACTVGDACLIGMGAIVMDGAVIEPEVIVAAGALVAPGKTLESGHLYAGSPARRVRALNDRERDQLYYSAAHYVKLKNRHRSGWGG